MTAPGDDVPLIDDPGCQLLLRCPEAALPADAAATLGRLLDEIAIAGCLIEPAPGGAAPADLRPLRQACAGRAACLVAGDLALALALEADGLQLDPAPADLTLIRARLGAERIIGAVCGRSRHAAMVAGEAGADYIVLGEPAGGADPELLALIGWWHELFVLPCLVACATSEEAVALAGAGADLLAIGPALWHDPAALARLRAAIEPA